MARPQGHLDPDYRFDFHKLPGRLQMCRALNIISKTLVLITTPYCMIAVKAFVLEQLDRCSMSEFPNVLY